jgi:hypothetical protein
MGANEKLDNGGEKEMAQWTRKPQEEEKDADMDA